MAGGAASEAAVDADADRLETLYLDCALRLDRLIDAARAWSQQED